MIDAPIDLISEEQNAYASLKNLAFHKHAANQAALHANHCRGVFHTPNKVEPQLKQPRPPF